MQQAQEPIIKLGTVIPNWGTVAAIKGDHIVSDKGDIVTFKDIGEMINDVKSL